MVEMKRKFQRVIGFSSTLPIKRIKDQRKKAIELRQTINRQRMEAIRIVKTIDPTDVRVARKLLLEIDENSTAFNKFIAIAKKYDLLAASLELALSKTGEGK